VTTQANGEYEANMRLLRVRPDASVVSADGTELESFRQTWWTEAHDWDSTYEIPPFPARTEATALQVTEARLPHSESRWDLLPLAYQYPFWKLGLTADVGVTWPWHRKNRLQADYDEGVLAGGRFLIPLTDEAHPNLGGPNYLSLGMYYSGSSNDMLLNLGMNWGLLETLVFVDQVTKRDPFIGGELRFTTLLPFPPDIGVWGGSDLDGRWGLGANVLFSLPFVTLRIGD